MQEWAPEVIALARQSEAPALFLIAAFLAGLLVWALKQQRTAAAAPAARTLTHDELNIINGFTKILTEIEDLADLMNDQHRDLRQMYSAHHDLTMEQLREVRIELARRRPPAA